MLKNKKLKFFQMSKEERQKTFEPILKLLMVVACGLILGLVLIQTL